jgi:hypothetical protein
VIEACAGSGKTWMLVSRIVRLLLAGAQPSQILAITFTRKAAQVMATRLRDWLHELATESDGKVREFLRERAIPEAEIGALLPEARQLYERFLTAQPPITIATFHSWFLQILRRAPLDAGALGDVNLLEQTSALVDEAWESFASGVQRDRESPAARGLDWLFSESGLENTRRLLTHFLQRRADWRAYTHGQKDPVGYALGRIRAEMAVAPDADVRLVNGDALARELLKARDYRAQCVVSPDRRTTAGPAFGSGFNQKRPQRDLRPASPQAQARSGCGETRFELHAPGACWRRAPTSLTRGATASTRRLCPAAWRCSRPTSG